MSTLPNKKFLKIAFPLKIEIDPMERLIVVSLKGDREFDMIEPQVFDDPVNGKGMRILMYRKDQKVDVYWQRGVSVSRDTFSIGAGIGQFNETVIQPSRFDITDRGVYLHIKFTDAQGRTVELKIEEHSDGIRPFPFLAPVGNDIADPKKLFLAHMLEFDFVRKKGTDFSGKIGDRSLHPESFPILRNYKQVIFARYSANPVVGTLNPPMKEPVIFEMEVPGRIEVDGMDLHVDKDRKIKQVFVLQNKKKVAMEFPDGFPNLYDVKEGAREKGKWKYHIADMLITGGTYFLSRSGNAIKMEIDVTQSWKPINMPWSFKWFTWFIRFFRNWPATYIWNGTINLDDNTLAGNWRRKKQQV